MNTQNIRKNLPLVNITIWIFLGIWILISNWQQNHSLLTPFIFLPIIMITLTFIRWFLQTKPHQYTRQALWIMTLFAIVILFVAATLVNKT